MISEQQMPHFHLGQKGAMTLSIMGLVTTLSINDIQPNSIECHYGECRDYLNVMLSVVRLNVVMLCC
jgi:hypothetical protein